MGYCFEKDAQWSSCLADCIPGKENGDEHNRPQVAPGMPAKNPPSHWNVTFKKAPGEVERRLSLLLHVRVQELWQETNGRLSDSCLRAEGTHSYLRMRSLGRLQRRRRSAEPWQNYQSSIPEGGQTPANEGLGQFVRVHQRMEEHQR